MCNILLNHDDTIPSEWYQIVLEECVLTGDYEGGENTNDNGNSDFDRRDAVCNAILEDLNVWNV